jgi:hypothetical protein
VSKPQAPTFDKPPVPMHELDLAARYVGIAPERVRALFGVLAMVAPPAEEQAPAQAKLEPLQPTNRELIATVFECVRMVNILTLHSQHKAEAALEALTELEKRIGGE